MDNLTPIRNLLYRYIKFINEEEIKSSTKLEDSCGIKSTYYPPSELYPNGHKVVYPFAISPNQAKQYK